METDSNDEDSRSVVIIGGSLSGLMHGIVLKRLGHNVSILERSPAAFMASQGAGIGVSSELESFMKEFDGTGKPYMLCPEKALIVDAQGNLITDATPPNKATSWTTLYYRLRAMFDGLNGARGVDMAAVPNSVGPTYIHGRSVSSVEEKHQNLRVIYQDLDGTQGYMDADLVIVADGAGSILRQLVAPQVRRQYVGYCGWRGTVPEQDLERETNAVFQGNDRHCKIDGSLFLSYTIPGRDGELSAGNCGRNWIWYRNYAEGSKELEEILTDTAMQQHRHSIAPGQSRAEVWARQKRLAEEVLDKTSAQVVQKTKQPFLQAITEVLPQQACFLNQRLLLVGDAFATLRPLSGLGTGQAARSAILLKEVMLQQKTWEEYEVEVMQTAHAFGQIGVAREKALGLGVI